MNNLLQKSRAISITLLVLCGVVSVTVGYLLCLFIRPGQVTYSEPKDLNALVAFVATSTLPIEPPPFVVTHVSTPPDLKAVYFTSYAAASDKLRKHLIDLVETTEVNAVVIDVKDYTGRISFLTDDPVIKELGSGVNRIYDVKEFIGELHKRNVYVIARISSFQDSYLINVRPEWAVRTETSGEIWQDYKGVKWLDPGARPVWDYLVRVGNESYKVGFDELNFDYIRFPSDGNLKDIAYPWASSTPRTVIMKEFFSFLDESFPTIPISADLFGLTTSAAGDLGIGQVLTDGLQHFDYIYPMVYPSHFSKGFLGLAKPAAFPYEVIKYSMDHAVVKALNASSTSSKLRPWLQAFDLGAIYTPAMIRSEMQATYDAGLEGWLLWNPSSVYNKESLLPKGAAKDVIKMATTTTAL